MKKNTKQIILIIALVVVMTISVILLISFINKEDKEAENTVETVQAPTRAEIAEEYQYNTDVLANENLPVAIDPGNKDTELKIDAIEGYTQVDDQSFVQLPYSITDDTKEVLQILSVGKYTGIIDGGLEVKNAFAMVVMNTTDKSISIANITVDYADGKMATFSPSNLPPKCASVVFGTLVVDPNAGPIDNNSLSYSAVKKFEVTDVFSLLTDEITFVDETVGVDYANGQFIITNLTNKFLGDVYIRYKTVTDGNAYLGGMTYSVVAHDVAPYETYHVDGENFSVENSAIISVECVN